MDGFLTLTAEDRRLALEQAESRLRLPAASIEKDFWVCFTLRELFSLPDWKDNLTFKGGTSLSKAWGLIERFSEDIDLVIDRGFLGMDESSDPATAKGNVRRRRLESIRERARERVRGNLMPALETAFQERLPVEMTWRLEPDPEASEEPTILFHYPAVLAGTEYLRSVVKIELGARSDTEPLETPEIGPDIGRIFPEAVGPSRFPVRAVAARRTFLEKALLLHEEALRSKDKPLKPRLSRHYYDVSRLIERGIADQALADPYLFKSVVRHRSIYFRQTWVDYEALTTETLDLLPSDVSLSSWEADYAQMKEAMFYGEPPSFDQILTNIGRFQDRLRAR